MDNTLIESLIRSNENLQKANVDLIRLVTSQGEKIETVIHEIEGNGKPGILRRLEEIEKTKNKIHGGWIVIMAIFSTLVAILK